MHRLLEQDKPEVPSFNPEWFPSTPPVKYQGNFVFLLRGRLANRSAGRSRQGEIQ
jgi:hypothetical protein